jgi:hypothetical protein
MSFLEIFQPGLKHLREEKDRQRMLVVRPSHGGGPPLGIDLDAGTASIVVSRRADAVDETADGETHSPSSADQRGPLPQLFEATQAAVTEPEQRSVR